MSEKKAAGAVPEWSHMVEAEKAAEGPYKITISPRAAEKTRLARRIGVEAVDHLEADLVFLREAGEHAIHVKGHIRAEVIQKCIVTGEQIRNPIADDFEAWFADEAEALSFVKARQEKLSRSNHVEMPILEESEDPEPIVNGQIDAGELVAQYLSLAVDPYPRAEGAHYDKGGEAESVGAPDEIFKNPFAALKDWKTKRE